ncbi:unnamed protein product [Candidula unifasciata]|uniref:GH18 domain-containing protein n=1 Tax=Candidula unifasciata TaxID=100452 RepID=A0A8S3ZTN2_9EUPU|nr:unnamed protein product [Candidula unifasciata]
MEVSCVLAAACLLLFCGSSCSRNVICFYTNWAQYRSGSASFTVSKIDPTLCTHINFAFAKLDGNNIAEYEYNDKEMWKQLNDLKQTNPSLKTFLSVGGATLGHGPFSNMVFTKENRIAFINSAIAVLRSFSFDGLDVDWEFPTATDKQNLKLFTQEVSEAFKMEGQNTSRSPLLLSFCVPAGLSTIDSGYDVGAMNR